MQNSFLHLIRFNIKIFCTTKMISFQGVWKMMRLFIKVWLKNTTTILGPSYNFTNLFVFVTYSQRKSRLHWYLIHIVMLINTTYFITKLGSMKEKIWLNPPIKPNIDNLSLKFDDSYYHYLDLICFDFWLKQSSHALLTFLTL